MSFGLERVFEMGKRLAVMALAIAAAFALCLAGCGEGDKGDKIESLDLNEVVSGDGYELVFTEAEFAKVSNDTGWTYEVVTDKWTGKRKGYYVSAAKGDVVYFIKGKITNRADEGLDLLNQSNSKAVFGVDYECVVDFRMVDNQFVGAGKSAEFYLIVVVPERIVEEYGDPVVIWSISRERNRVGASGDAATAYELKFDY